jgi:hypothetical protein
MTPGSLLPRGGGKGEGGRTFTVKSLEEFVTTLP